MSAVTNRQLAATVAEQLAAGASRAKVVKSLAGYLVAERRSKDLEAIMRLVEQALQRQTGRVEVTITSARQLSEIVRKEIRQLFQAKTNAKKLIVNEIIDPQVIGGVLVESPEQRLDLTVRRQLQRLTEMGA